MLHKTLLSLKPNADISHYSEDRGFGRDFCFMTEKEEDVRTDRFYGRDFLAQYLQENEEFLGKGSFMGLCMGL